jgi:CDP-diacylglycerol pyrophosphatase
LLDPTQRISGIESPAILAPGATSYVAAAWRARSFVDERAGQTLARDWVSLAVNSEVSRSQNQLHIHIDCVRADVHEALTEHVAEIGAVWTPIPVPLAGHLYSAIAVRSDDLDAVNPFSLLANGLSGAGPDMGLETLVVVGAIGVEGQPGFVILAGRADNTTGDTGSGEDVQDHTSCPPPVMVIRGGSRRVSGGRREFHPPAPTDPGVTISRHRALVILTTRNRAPMPSGRRAGDADG